MCVCVCACILTNERTNERARACVCVRVRACMSGYRTTMSHSPYRVLFSEYFRLPKLRFISPLTTMKINNFTTIVIINVPLYYQFAFIFLYQYVLLATSRENVITDKQRNMILKCVLTFHENMALK